MGDVINFRKARKDLARKTRDETAERNRAAFGRTKAQKQEAAQVTELADRRLDSHRRDSMPAGAPGSDGNGTPPA